MAELDGDVMDEIFSISTIYGPAFEDVPGDKEFPRKFTLSLEPHVEGGKEKFVDCKILFKIGRNYPQKPPAIEVTGTKGLSDADVSDLQEKAVQEARELVGDVMVGPLDGRHAATFCRPLTLRVSAAGLSHCRARPGSFGRAEPPAAAAAL